MTFINWKPVNSDSQKITFDFNAYNYRLTKVTNTGSSDITLFVNNIVSATLKKDSTYLVNRGNFNITDGMSDLRTAASGQALVIQRETKTTLLTGRVSDLEKGTLLDFAGRKWFLLDPEKGFITTQSSVANKKFNEKTGGDWDGSLTDTSTIWYYLNTTFYNTISAVDKSIISNKSWGVGGLNSYQSGISNTKPTMTTEQMRAQENTSVITANVGILSVSEWREYSSYFNELGGFLDTVYGGCWLRTKYIQTDNKYSFIAGKTIDSNSGFHDLGAGLVSYYTIAVLPTMYIKPETYVVNGVVIANSVPILTLNTIDNQTLYENDTILLDGQASDVNNGDIVNVKYSIDGGTARAITTAISNGTTPVPFSKQLQFIKGILYDGQAALTDVLTEGNAHNIKVWAEDDKGGKSAEKVITFHVVANRAPLITIDPFIKVNDLINSDSITIEGDTSDPEGQNVKIRYNINSGAFTEFYNAAAGPFTLNISLDKLRDGLNTLQLQVEDSYGFITSKTLNVNKTFNSTPILKSVARYKNILPVGGIIGMVSWIESMDGDLNVNMSASMVMSGEQESFEEMSLTNSAPTDLNIEENEFVIQADTKKDNVSIKIDISRTEVSNDKAVKRITGALQT